MKQAIMLTIKNGSKIIVGVESIIQAYEVVQNSNGTIPKDSVGCTKIESRHAMVTHCIVLESVEEIYNLIEGNNNF